MKALWNGESDHEVQINPKNSAGQAARCSNNFKFTSFFIKLLSFIFLFFKIIFIICFYVLVFVFIRETKAS